MPTYNREMLLPQAIESAIAQTYTHWELIVVDDRSIDGTEALVRRYMEDDGRIVYARNTHAQGCAGARNQGWELAKGRYVAFLDSDDQWKPHHLQAIMTEFARNDDVDWIYADSETVEDGRIVTQSVFGQLWKDKDKLPVERRGRLGVLEQSDLLTHAMRYGVFAGCQCSVMRRSVFDVHGFDEKLLATEDWFFLLCAITRGCRLAYLEEVHLTYRLHPDSTSAHPKKPVEENLVVYVEFEKVYLQALEQLPLTRAQRSILRDMLAELYLSCFVRKAYRMLGDRAKVNEYLMKGLRLRPRSLPMWKALLVNNAGRWSPRAK